MAATPQYFTIRQPSDETSHQYVKAMQPSDETLETTDEVLNLPVMNFGDDELSAAVENGDRSGQADPVDGELTDEVLEPPGMNFDVAKRKRAKVLQ